MVNTTLVSVTLMALLAPTRGMANSTSVTGDTGHGAASGRADPSEIGRGIRYSNAIVLLRAAGGRPKDLLARVAHDLYQRRSGDGKDTCQTAVEVSDGGQPVVRQAKCSGHAAEVQD